MDNPQDIQDIEPDTEHEGRELYRLEVDDYGILSIRNTDVEVCNLRKDVELPTGTIQYDEVYVDSDLSNIYLAQPIKLLNSQYIAYPPVILGGLLISGIISILNLSLQNNPVLTIGFLLVSSLIYATLMINLVIKSYQLLDKFDRTDWLYELEKYEIED